MARTVVQCGSAVWAGHDAFLDSRGCRFLWQPLMRCASLAPEPNAGAGAGAGAAAAAAAAAAATVNAQCDKSVKLYHTKHSCDGLLFQLAVSVATAFILPSNRCIDGKLWTLSNLDSRSSQAPKVCLFDSVRLDCGWCMLYRWEIVDTIQF